MVEEYEKLKKPLNAFILFSNEVRKGNLTDQRLGLDAAADFANESKVTSEKWKQMSEEEKAPWYEKAQQMKLEYDGKLDELKSQGFHIPARPLPTRYLDEMKSQGLSQPISHSLLQKPQFPRAQVLGMGQSQHHTVHLSSPPVVQNRSGH